MEKPGILGVALTASGVALLLVTFIFAYLSYASYASAAAQDLTDSLDLLLLAAIKALFLGIMAWVGGILLVRGVDFLKVEKGVGMVTMKVDKGVALITAPEEAVKPKE
ncbi:MAG TPA: hypothetical protein VMS77_03325 [Conexivisphaerales archaeon]|nr:hypothetical protein [Conexivisphaerales archaeon]